PPEHKEPPHPGRARGFFHAQRRARDTPTRASHVDSDAAAATRTASQSPGTSTCPLDRPSLRNGHAVSATAVRTPLTTMYAVTFSLSTVASDNLRSGTKSSQTSR